VRMPPLFERRLLPANLVELFLQLKLGNVPQMRGDHPPTYQHTNIFNQDTPRLATQTGLHGQETELDRGHFKPLIDACGYLETKREEGSACSYALMVGPRTVLETV
jgi:hypothetical protein